jgi:Tfp pilus assembly protein PilP
MLYQNAKKHCENVQTAYSLLTVSKKGHSDLKPYIIEQRHRVRRTINPLTDTRESVACQYWTENDSRCHFGQIAVFLATNRPQW